MPPHPPPPRPESTSETLAAALERLPQASESAWLRGLLLVVASVLVLGAWAFVAAADNLATSSAGDAEALNLAGRQVFLAERLGAEATTAASGEDSALPLEHTLNRMRDDAVRLYELRGVWGVGDEEPDHWTARRERLWAAAQSLQMARERGEPRLGPYTARVQGEARQFIAAMEQATGELQRLAEARHLDTRRAHGVLVGVLAFGIITLLIGLGEPLARRMKLHHSRLAAQTQQLDAILRALPAGLMVQDAQGRVIDANLKAEQLTGLQREQLVGRAPADPGWDLVDEEGAPLAPTERPSLVTLRTGTPQVDRPVGVRTPDGQRRWLRVSTQTLPGPDGSTQGVVTCFLDETEVRAQRNLLRTTIDGAGVGTWDWNMTTGHIDYNERWARMFGFEPDEVPRNLEGWQGLVHPEDAAAAKRALHAHLADPAVPYRTEFRMRTKQGGWTWVLAAGAVIERGPDGRGRRMAGVNVDIHTRKRLEQALSDAALTDSLTRLPNRAGIQQALARCVARVHEKPDEAFAVLFMDFDRFKLVNDSLGHEAGDELLRQIAQRVKQTLRPGDGMAPLSTLGDVAGRLGGDEFVVLLDHIRQPADAQRVAQRLLDALGAPYALAGRHVQSSASIGIVTSDVSSATVESVLRDADTAMYEAKRRGRGRYVVFDPEMHRRIRHALELEADLRQALQRDEFFVAYQPIVALPERRPQTLEALVRWHHPARGLVSPADFVPLAEEAGLIEALGEFVLRRACADLADWQKHLGDRAPRSVSVNLSRAQLRPARLAATVRAALADSGLAPAALRLEITETLAMQGESSLAVLAELRRMGIGLALDDFGTGYSSLASLDQLPIDTVKIDRAFVAKMVSSPYQAALVKSTVQVADTLGLRVVAEGVETESQAAALVALGCHAAQGFLFSRPMPAADFADWWAAEWQRCEDARAALPA
ncbi:MAG: putative bifunctional diguanylate cyclase/phosphodiesterase [Pseudomonadota bacterium]